MVYTAHAGFIIHPLSYYGHGSDYNGAKPSCDRKEADIVGT